MLLDSQAVFYTEMVIKLILNSLKSKGKKKVGLSCRLAAWTFFFWNEQQLNFKLIIKSDLNLSQSTFVVVLLPWDVEVILIANKK